LFWLLDYTLIFIIPIIAGKLAMRINNLNRVIWISGIANIN